jgi:hypothetical protein
MRFDRIPKLLAGAAVPMLLYLADVSPAGWTLVREAHAVVGAPLTPGSVAGVARRTTVVAASANAASQQQQAAAAQQQQQAAAAARPPGAPPVGTVVAALPAGCVAETRNGVAYQNCGGVRYRAAFQGDNLVYVVE